MGEHRSTGDGATGDGATGDGATGDGATEDGATEDGETEDGATEDGSSEDGATDDGSTQDGEDADSLLGLSDDDVLSDGDVLLEDAQMSDLVEDESDLEVQGVVVTAHAIDEDEATGGGVERLGERLLERFNYDNPDAVIQQVPGAYVRQEDGYGLRPNIGLRGVSSDRSSRITLMEDGILFGPAPYAAPAAYYFPLMTRMTGVDVYTGVAAVPYGPTTVGGAIDFHNRDLPEHADGALDLAFGNNTFGRAHGWVGIGNEWGALAIEGIYLRTDGFKHIVLPDGTNEGTGFDRGELVLRGDLHGALSSDVYHRLELRLGLSGESSYESYLGLSETDYAADPFQRYSASQLDHMGWWRTSVELRHRLEVGDGFVLESAAYRHDLDRSWLKVNAMGGLPTDDGLAQTRVDLFDVLYGGQSGRNAVLTSILRGESDGGLTPSADDYVLIGTNARRFGSTGLQSMGTGRFATGPLDHVVRFGARLHHDAVDRHHTEDAYSTIDGDLVRATPETYTLLRTHAEALALSMYASWAVTLLDVLTVTPGLRTELIWTSFDDLEGSGAMASQFRDAFIPGVSVQWQAIEELELSAGVMRGFAPVAPGQAPTVQAEDSVIYEVGARFLHRASRTGAQINGYVSDYSNYLQQCSFASGCGEGSIDSQANGGRPLVAGVDARVELEPRVGDVAFPVRASYTFTYSELREDILASPSPLFFGARSGDALPYLPQHQLGLQAGIEHRDVGFNVSGTFVSRMLETAARFDDADAVLTDDQFLLDANLYIQVFQNLRVYVRGENLTLSTAVAGRRPLGARPVRPFQVQVGVQITP
ncbi:MAG: TonB-dependent receptor family protein [Sandaracinaceae bacterium]